MRLVWMTDIHLNFVEPAAVDRFLKRVADRRADGVVISGDIGEADSLFEYLHQFQTLLEIPVYFVLGNHDFYRGSIAKVRGALTDFLKIHPRLIWLNQAGVVSLTAATALIGHDSWADGRLGDYWHSGVELNDFNLISELNTRAKQARLDMLMKLGDQAAEHFKLILPEALKTHQKVLMVMHVSPFEGSSRYRGAVSDKNWLPFFSCRAVGEVLQSIMSEHPDREALVLCGHTHGAARFQALPNLAVIAGEARYRYPKVQMELVVE